MDKLRIVYVDYYLTKPTAGLDEQYAEFRGESIKRVPVIRIFGVTTEGEKACLHVHGVYPYFCIPIDSPESIDATTPEKEALHMKKLMRQLDNKITHENNRLHCNNNDAINCPPTKKYKSSRPDQIVHKIVSFDAYKMYGYNETKSHFYKISLYNPSNVTKASSLFSSGLIDLFPGKVQSYQNHVPFILQFFIDYNLYGMNFIHLNRCYQRRHSNEIATHSMYDATAEQGTSSGSNIAKLKKMTTCTLEFDCKECDIAVKPGTGTDLIWKEEQDRCNQMDKSFNLAPSFSQERPAAVNQVFKREADFLSIIDRICGLEGEEEASSSPCASQNASQGSTGKSNSQLESDFNRICQELMLESQFECETSSQQLKKQQEQQQQQQLQQQQEQQLSSQLITPRAGPSHLSHLSSSQYGKERLIHSSGFKNDSGCSDEEWDDEIDDKDFLEMVSMLGDLVPSTQQRQEQQQQQQQQGADGQCGEEEDEEEDSMQEEKDKGNINNDLNNIDVDDLEWAIEPDEELWQMLHESIGNKDQGNPGNIPQFDGGYEVSSEKSINRNAPPKGSKVQVETEDEMIDRRVTRRQSCKLLSSESVTSRNELRKQQNKNEERVKHTKEAKEKNKTKEKRRGETLDADVSDEEKKSITSTGKSSTSVSTCIERPVKAREDGDGGEERGRRRRRSERIAASRATYDTSSSSSRRNNMNNDANNLSVGCSWNSLEKVSTRRSTVADATGRETATTVNKRIAKVINGVSLQVPLQVTKEQLDQIASTCAVVLERCPSQLTGDSESQLSQQRQQRPLKAHHRHFTGRITSPSTSTDAVVKMVKPKKSENTHTITSLNGKVDVTPSTSSALHPPPPHSHPPTLHHSPPPPLGADNSESYESASRLKEIDSILPLTELKGREKVSFLFSLLPTTTATTTATATATATTSSSSACGNNGTSEQKNASLGGEKSSKEQKDASVILFSSSSAATKVTRKKLHQPSDPCSSQWIQSPKQSKPSSTGQPKSKMLQEKNGQSKSHSCDAMPFRDGNWDGGNFTNDLSMSSNGVVNSNEDQGDPLHQFVAGPFDEVSHVTRLSNLDEIELYSCYAYDSTIKSSQELDDNISTTHDLSSQEVTSDPPTHSHLHPHPSLAGSGGGGSLIDATAGPSGFGEGCNLQTTETPLTKVSKIKTNATNVDDEVNLTNGNQLLKRRRLVVEGALSKMRRMRRQSEKQKGTKCEHLSNTSDDEINPNDLLTSSPGGDSSGDRNITLGYPRLRKSRQVSSSTSSSPLHSTPTVISKRRIRSSSLPCESPILNLSQTPPSELKAIPENCTDTSPNKERKERITLRTHSARGANLLARRNRSLFPKMKCTIYSTKKYLQLREKGLLTNCKVKSSQSPSHSHRNRRMSQSSILSGPTLLSQEEFFHIGNSGKNNAVLSVTSPHEFQFVTLMSVEVFSSSRGSLLPDPAVDAIRAIFYSIHVDDPSTNGTTDSITTGILVTKPFTDDFASAFLNQSQKPPSQPISSNGSTTATDADAHILPGPPDSTSDLSSQGNTGPFSFVNENVKVTMANDEVELLFKFIDIIHSIDPDFLVGFEVEKSSWGYIVSRANYLNIRIATSISRLMEESDFKEASNSRNYNEETDGGCHISAYNLLQFPGRVLLDVWNIMRHEVTLDMYSFENCYYHVLHKRIAKFTNEVLFKWYNQGVNVTGTTVSTTSAGHGSVNLEEKKNEHTGHGPMWRVFEYFVTRVEGNLNLLLELNFVGKHSTLARVYGIQFSDNISRGSQYRVESIMLRLAKFANMIPVSITPKERSDMKAVEYIPFVMEPESSYYTDPVIVLDFQSLYPSMMIAYNYCFTTCLGRVSSLSTSVTQNNGQGRDFEFGASTLKVPACVLKKYRKSLSVSPNGVAFVKSEVRRGLVPEMLDTLIRTRIMVKNAMKENMRPNGCRSKSLQRILDSRQLALKMVANTTYGYIGATISGRMPCVEIADAIVSKGKETLKRAIDMVHSNEKWNARVVYGDTDSLFILLPGRSKSEAFVIGNEIASAVTDDNPQPVKLKFEKVYHPCVLQTKKRYVGYSYESPDQVTPKFDAKGIETVRRDQIAATSKLLEKSLRLLFESNDMNVVKSYLTRQFAKMDAGSLGLVQDFIFAKEYRGKECYSAVSKVPANELVKKALEIDRRAEPRARTRVPYVIISGSPDQPLYELVRSPLDLIANCSLKLNVPYYLERVIIPALNRVFNLLGQDVSHWRNEMPKKKGFKCATFTHANNRSKRYIPIGAPGTSCGGVNSGNQATLSQYFLVSNCPLCYGRSDQPQTLCQQCHSTPHLTSVRLIDKIKKNERMDTSSWKRCFDCSRNPSVDRDHCISLECENLFTRVRANNYSINRSLCHKLLLESF